VPRGCWWTRAWPINSSRKQLRPERLEQVCRAAGQPLTLRRHEGYDHGYFFIATLVGEHVAHHAEGLRG
jgi:S-formylglutathione hydrolase